MSTTSAEEQIIQQEQRRQAALIQGDSEALGEILALNFWLCHSTGHISDRQGLINFVHDEIEFIDLERDNLQVRVYGNVATMTGDMVNTVRGKVKGDIVVVPLRVLQVWHNIDGTWKMISMQCTRFARENK